MPEKTDKEYDEQTRVKKPWMPAKTLEIPEKYRHPQFAYRWLDPNLSNLQARLEEGFEIDTEISKKMPIPERSLQLHAGKTIDGSLVRGGLVLARIPKDVAKAMEEYYTKETDAKMPSIKGNIASTRTGDGHNIRTYDPLKGGDPNNIMT